ncbi:ComEC/Rec2 family competence protein [Clostridium sp. YIM B02505]|uniref:ComEC/Rec2 family competence protein n=1 Tax=Clostridium yunnanense TaxID=2800325 RepID=A0ABS1EU78_9CLOT|nr:ComEC/Rec2 family competence protein [Clostridium yunnanense]MBK1812885.1 ComEC/Rec2 family competence protein [Clostridium yunnanense]
MVTKFINNEEISRPAVNILISCIAGIITFNLIQKNIYGAVLVAASFFLSHFIIHGKKFMVVICIFFIASYINCLIYYSLQAGHKEVFKVVAVNPKSKIVEMGRQSFKIDGINTELKDGSKYLIYGSFRCEPDIEKGIVGTIKVEKYNFLEYGFSGSINSKQDDFYNILKKYIGEEGAALVCSAAFGYTKYIKNDQNVIMNKYGIIHVVSVSGFHIAVVYSIMEKLLGFKFALVFSFIYTLFSGGKSSTWRAFLMIFILKLSNKVYRKYDSISALSFSAILLLVYKPHFIYDIGFNLSYLSTLGILLFYNKLKIKFYKLPQILSDTFCISIAAQVFSFPVATLTLNNFSPNFIWGNLFLLPLFTPIVILGNIAFMLMWSGTLLKVTAYIIKIFIIALQGGITVVDKISLNITTINPSIVYGYILMLICFYMYQNGYKKAKYFLWMIVFVVILSMYKFETKVTIITDGKTKGILMEQGFRRVLITKALSGYNYNILNKNYYPNESIQWKNKKMYSYNGITIIPKDEEREIVIVSNKNSYILTINNQPYVCNQSYDIIKIDENKSFVLDPKDARALNDNILDSEGDNGD